MRTPRSSAANAVIVALGILASRLFGLIRQRLFAHVFGSGLEAAAFGVATRIPNFLQNLLGDGVLAASFIPVYARLRARGDEANATRLAGAVFSALAMLVGVLVGVGLLASNVLVDLLAQEPKARCAVSRCVLFESSFPARGSWCCAPGVWVCSTAIDASFSRTRLQ